MLGMPVLQMLALRGVGMVIVHGLTLTLTPTLTLTLTLA